MTEERTIKYIGVGLSISGVPARDLTLTEYEKAKPLIEACPQTLYEVPEVKIKKSPKATEETGDK